MNNALKHIPCPAGKKCTAFQCIFGHEQEKDASANSQPADANRRPADNEALLPGDQDGPRKRLKVGPPGRLSEATPAVTDSSSTTDSENLNGKQNAKPDQLVTAVRPVSPPPLRRSASLHTKSAKSSHGSSAADMPPPRKSLGSLDSKSAGSPQSGKPETLNPRLLMSHPASHQVRLQLLRLLHREYQRLNSEFEKNAKGEEAGWILSEQQLIIRALDVEQSVAIEKAAVYANVMKNKVMQHKRMNVSQWSKERAEEVKAAQARGSRHGLSEEPVKIETGLTSAQEVQLLKRVLTPIDSLSNHGYVPTIPSEELIKAAQDGLDAAKGWEKCDRCEQRFQVFPGRRPEDGALTSGGSCTFHWGKPYVPPKPPGDNTKRPKRYRCCGEEVGDSVGCSTQDYHVFKASGAKRLAAILNFAETPPNPAAPADRAVCFDCEMGFTVYGLELIRLTATSWPTGEELLDVLVRPLGEVLDLNSRFSGVWPDDMARAETWSAGDDLHPPKRSDDAGSEDGEVRSVKDKIKIVASPSVARELLFSLISPATPLIGHGLENDLNAVRVVHPTLVDTVLLYPHKAGLPYRYGLKMLMDLHLNRKIQQESGPKVLGHDSAEDARAAGDLARLRVMKEWKDMQRAGWKLIGDVFVPPEGSGAEGKLSEAFIES